jgi:signal transduction histidine kinase
MRRSELKGARREERAAVAAAIWGEAFDLSGLGLALIADRRIQLANATFQRTASCPVARADGGVEAPLSVLLLEEAVRAPDRNGIRHRRYRSRDNTRWLEVTFEADGAAVMVAVEEVSALEGARRALERAGAELARLGRLAAVSELAAGVAHDLGNTLAAALLRSASLRREPTIAAAHADDLESLRRLLLEGTGLLRKLQNLAAARERVRVRIP